MKPSKRIHSIDLLRFIFALQIAMWHFRIHVPFMANGYLAVEFFFLLSGFLLYRSSQRRSALSPLHYAIHKFKRLYFPFLLVVLTLNMVWVDKFAIFPSLFLRDIFLVSNTSFFQWGADVPMWYLRVLLIGGALIYSMLKVHERWTTNVFLPIFIIGVYTFILHRYDGKLETWETYGPFSLPLLRGMAGMGLGCLLAKFMQVEGEKFLSCYRKMLDLGLLISFFLVFFFMSNTLSKHFDIYVLGFFMCIVFVSFSPYSKINKWVTSSFCTYLGELSYFVYIVHFACITIAEKAFQTFHVATPILQVIIYLLLVLIFSVCYYHLYEKIKRMYYKRKHCCVEA